jgi:transposase
VEHCGIDLHAKSSEAAVIGEEGAFDEPACIPTTEPSFMRWIGNRAPLAIWLEAEGQSAWAGLILRSLGHDVVVANPARVRLMAEATLTNHTVDAMTLARLVRADRALLSPIVHKSPETQHQRGVLRARRTRVNARTACLNTARGILRSFGCKTPSRPAARLAEALDERIERMGGAHPHAALLRTAPGVGPLVALACVLCIEDPPRFSRSRDVGAHLGLRPKMRESADTSRNGSITRQGETGMRRLLVQAAHGLPRCHDDAELTADRVQRRGEGQSLVFSSRCHSITGRDR